MAKGKPFVYGGRSSEDVSRRAKQSTGNYDSAILEGFTMFKPKEGENVVRILPPSWLNYDKAGKVIKDEVYERWGSGWECQIWVHNNIGPDRGSFLCLSKMQNEPCPICEARSETTDDDERYALAPNLRALCWVIDRNDQKAGPQWWSMPMKSVFKVICTRSIDKKTGGVILIDNPDEGYDISFTREGSGLKTDYTAIDVDRDPTPLHEGEKTVAKWLDYIQTNPIPEILNFPDPDYVDKVLMGKVSKKSRKDDDEEDEEEETSGRMKRKPRRADADEEEEDVGRKPRSRGRVSDDDEEDEAPKRSRAKCEPDEEEEEEEDEGESEAPKSRRGKSKAPPADDDDTGEEETDEPKPRSKRKAAEPEEEEEEEVKPRSRRRAEPVEEEEEDEPASKSAKKVIERVKPKAKKKPVEDDEEDEDD